ncbi:hypothetical protein RJT34_10857 [Clitoria ternatea]|uniref:Uncharacterized protein n=1 Tax=Clitoria ternatea TaxID=43366 RepID=A0AAN9JKT2_CLITE
MAGGHFNNLLHATSRSSLLNPTRPFFKNTIRNYGQASNGNRGRLMEERAPSTAEEFQRVAEEKAKEAKERVANHSVSDNKDESGKHGYKEHEVKKGE